MQLYLKLYIIIFYIFTSTISRHLSAIKNILILLENSSYVFIKKTVIFSKVHIFNLNIFQNLYYIKYRDNQRLGGVYHEVVYEAEVV